MNFSSIFVPLMITGILVFGLIKRVDVFTVFLEGAKEGLMICMRILPALVALMTAVGMFKASGALDILTSLAAPVTDLFSIPREVVPLALLRPVSGSGALAYVNELLQTFGPDSFIGRVGSVMLGSTETTFYTIAVYYGSVMVTKTRHTLWASLAADMVGFIMSVMCVRLFY